MNTNMISDSESDDDSSYSSYEDEYNMYEYTDAEGRPYLDTLIPTRVYTQPTPVEPPIECLSDTQLMMLTNLVTGEEIPYDILDKYGNFAVARHVYAKMKEDAINDEKKAPFLEFQKKADAAAAKMKHDAFMAKLPRFSTGYLKKLKDAEEKLKTKPQASIQFCTWKKGVTASNTNRNAWNGSRRNGGGKRKIATLKEMNSEQAASERASAKRLRQKSNKLKNEIELIKRQETMARISSQMVPIQKVEEQQKEETDFQKFKRDELEYVKCIQREKLKTNDSELIHEKKIYQAKRNNEILNSKIVKIVKIDKRDTVVDKKKQLTDSIAQSMYVSYRPKRGSVFKNKTTGKGIVKTRLCKSLTIKGGVCRHNERCRFAHTPNELNVIPCSFGDRCRRVKQINGKWTNVDSQICPFGHSGESENKLLLCQRIGMVLTTPRKIVDTKTRVFNITIDQVSQTIELIKRNRFVNVKLVFH